MGLIVPHAWPARWRGVNVFVVSFSNRGREYSAERHVETVTVRAHDANNLTLDGMIHGAGFAQIC